MKDLLKKKYIWIPCLIVIAAGLILLFVLCCKTGTDTGTPSPEAVTSAEDPSGTQEAADTETGTQLIVSGDTEPADYVDWEDDTESQSSGSQQSGQDTPAGGSSQSGQGGTSAPEDGEDPTDDTPAEPVSDVDTLYDGQNWSPIN